MPLLHLDYEVYSELPLAGRQSVGTHRYAHDSSTRVLLAGFAVDDSGVEVLEGFNPRLPGPTWTGSHDRLARMLTEPAYEIVSFNAEFERLITQFVVGIPVGPKRWLCSMARAWSLSFTGPMAEVCKQIGLHEDLQKLADGKRLMQKFCSPRRVSKKNPDGLPWSPEDDPAGWLRFVEYCRQDVVASRAIYKFCERYPWPPVERDMWILDQQINDAGWPVDVALIQNANKVRQEEEARLLEQMKAVTGLDNPNSRDQMMGWLETQGSPLPDLQKETVAEFLSGPIDLPNFGDGMTAAQSLDVEKVLRLRQQMSRATPKKWDALHRMAHEGRMKATLEFGAASRTQRWGGRGFQPQNLYTERVHDTDQLADILTHATRGTVEALYVDTMGALSGAIRSAVTAPDGHRLVVSDFSSIESRLLGYFAGEERINGIFRRGEDTYRDLASRVFDIPVESVTKKQRTFCKPPELGCGYMLGLNGASLVAYAAGMGVTMDLDEAKRIVRIWRESNPAVVAMWEWFRAASIDTVQNYNVHEGHGVRFRRDEQFMVIDLPSGRGIYYYQPEVRENDYGSWSVTYMGRYQDDGGAWRRVFTHPGKTTENIIQAEARDILRDALLEIHREHGHYAQIVGHVHDEPVQCVPTEHAERLLAATNGILSTTPACLPGLILGAEGFITRRYKKG